MRAVFWYFMLGVFFDIIILIIADKDAFEKFMIVLNILVMIYLASLVAQVIAT